jgi:NTE family protein
MGRKYPFKNLVFKGGGIKAFAYIGALEVFEEQKILPHIERVAGNSAGSIMSTLLSFQLSADETATLFATLDYGKVATLVPEEDKSKEGVRPPQALREAGHKLVGGTEAINRLRTKFGLFSSEYIHSWLEETIASQCQGDGRASFADFRTRGFRDLYIVATNISSHTTTLFSAATTPDVAVVDAAMASSSIPFFFEALQFDGKSFGQGDYFVDGGVLTNYPIHVFDDPRFKKDNHDYVDGVNWETLGLRLYTPGDCQGDPEPITNLPSYVRNLVETLSITEDVSFKHSIIDQLRTINISNCCVDTIDFSIKPGGDNPKYEELLEAGRSATRDFLDGYESPRDKFASFRKRFGRFFQRS